MSAIDHVRYLAETIGPRGSTTSAEAAAAEYAFGELKRSGLRPVIEPFRSARSAWAPFSVLFGFVIAAGFLFQFAGRLGAIVGLGLSTAALVSALVEMRFRPNPLRWLLPKGESQNVWAAIDAEVSAAEQVVLVAHLDTHRTPLVFSTDGWVRLFGKLVPIGLGCAVLLIALFALGVGLPWPALRYASIAPLGVALGILALTLQADFTPYTAGANDNASGVGVVLDLAARLAAKPLSHASVRLLLTGCEEVGCYGADAFLGAHRDELGRAVWIAIDTVGSRDADPAYVIEERFLATTRSHPDLIRLAEGIGKDHPEWRVRPIITAGAYTEGAIGAKHGLRVLTLHSQPRSGAMVGSHRPSDTVENVSEATLEDAVAFVWEMLVKLDGRTNDGRT